MRYFEHFPASTTRSLFSRLPGELDSTSAPAVTGATFGATLYMPGSRPQLPADLAKQRRRGLLTAVVDFEDSLPRAQHEGSCGRAIALIDELSAHDEPIPRLFLRMRTPGDLHAVADALTPAAPITGFVFPKFEPLGNGSLYLDALDLASERLGRQALGMPILESAAFAYRESRPHNLDALIDLVGRRPDGIACIRIGGTDLASAFGLRRAGDSTIYEIRVVADVISDIVNAFVRPGGASLPVSAPVWEHFSARDRIMKPQLRETPFVRRDASAIRSQLVGTGLDTLVGEITLDKLNGLTGKTVIHPSHVGLVHALSVVTHEEYSDAASIIAREQDGGVSLSPAGNKMNEVLPHVGWARRVLARAEAFGVAQPEVDFVDFLVASDEAMPA